VMNNYGDHRVSLAASRYYALQNAAENVRTAKRVIGHYVKFEKTGDRAVDAALARLHKAIERAEKQVCAAEQANGIKAKLVEKPKPVKKARPRSKK